ncbi:alpha/beta fold hydrolase [Aquimarina sp. AU474]|uniref:alpha/beta fold hydrolase n=1 Tax=Aquimarina sp. AU474 TaxID=2108529 RepID=UPI000D68D8C1|nr:alpha/beta hydrolase [Aquimarina sp. AU474]
MKKAKKIIAYVTLGLGICILTLISLGHTNLGNLPTTENSENNFVTVRNEKIRILQKGNGKDVLFIHGSPGLIEDWNSIFDSLAQNYRVTAFDRPGHGYSSSNEYTYHIQDNALIVEELITKLKLKDPLIVGHSYGGSTIAYMVTNGGLKNLKYIIIDSPLYRSRSALIYKLVSTPLIGKGIAVLSSYTIAKGKIKDGVTPIFKSINKEKIDELVKERQKIWSQPKVIYSKSKETVNYQSDLDLMSDKYKNITSDITIISGTDSLSTLRKDCEKFHTEVKNSKLILLDQTGHYIQFDKAEEVLAIIRGKIESN